MQINKDKKRVNKKASSNKINLIKVTKKFNKNKKVSILFFFFILFISELNY